MKNRTPSRIITNDDFFIRGEKEILKFSGHCLIREMIKNVRRHEIRAKMDVATQISERAVGNLSSMGFNILLTGNKSQKKKAMPKKRLGLLGLAKRSERRKSQISHDARRTIGMIWGIKCRGTL